MVHENAIIAQTQSELAETKTFRGEDYLVVPVVAMVEGVRFGANQSEAELGLSTEFGKVPTAWDNRPIVVDHPQVNGTFVTANRVDVLEELSFGFTVGANIDDDKLKLEAWILKAQAEENDEVATFIEAIDNDEMIEVSVGFFSDLEKTNGIFNGQSYAGIWRNIIPDHLAFLTEAKGACSIEDGCGVPRLNQRQEDAMSKMTIDSKTKAKATTQKTKTETEPCNCGCDGLNTPGSDVLQAQNDKQLNQCPPDSEDCFELSIQAIASSITSSSVRNNLETALGKWLEVRDISYYDFYLLTYTNGDDSMAIFNVWSSQGYVMQGIRFDMDDSAEVTFVGEPVDVRMVSHVIPSGNQENNMSNQNQASETTADPNAPEVQTTAVPGTESEVTPIVVKSATELVPETETEIEPKVLSRDDVLKNMSEDDQAEIEAALKVHAAQKADAIKTLKESGRCNFDDDYLNAQSLSVLENLVELGSVGDYSGRQVPVDIDVQTQEEDPNGLVPAPKVFAHLQKKTA